MRIRPSRHQIADQALKASVQSDSDQRSVQFRSDQSQSPRPQDQFSSRPVYQYQAAVVRAVSVYYQFSRSSINIDNSLREKINSLLKNEILYRDILEEMESTGRNEIKRGQEKFKLQKKLLMIHVTGQPEDVQYWRVVVPDDLDVKSLLVSELHSCTIFAAHPGVQRTIGKVTTLLLVEGHGRRHQRVCRELPDLPTGEDGPHTEKGKPPVPGHTRGQMARS